MKITFSSRRTRALWSGALALSFGLVLAGCGGGGGRSGPDSATITPGSTPNTPTRQNISCSTTYTPNYGDSVTLLRWTNFALRVYFKRDSQYSAARQALAVEGFDNWVRATNNRATYTIVNSASASNVQVSFFVFNGGPGDTLGTTKLSFYEDSRTIVSADIALGLTGRRANDVTTANHEFGHALGIFGHSPDERDLMYFEGNDRFSGEITTPDLNTLLTSYCGDFPSNSANRTAAHRGALKTVTIH